MVGWIGMVLVVPSTLVGWGGPKTGVWAIWSLTLIVGFTGSGKGPRTGGAEYSVAGAIEGEVGVGTTRIGGSGWEVGGSREGTGVGVLFNCRLTRFTPWGFLFTMCQPTTGYPSLADMVPSFAENWTLLISGMLPWSRAHPSFHDSRAPFSTTFLAFPGPAMKADMSNKRLLTTGTTLMCSRGTCENFLMMRSKLALCSAAIFVKSASKMTVRTVTGSSEPQVKGWRPLMSDCSVSRAGSVSALSSGYTSTEKTVLGNTWLPVFSVISSPDTKIWYTPLSCSRAKPLRMQLSLSQYNQVGKVSFPVSVSYKRKKPHHQYHFTL